MAMGKNFSKELKLANELKDLCDDTGAEISPIETAHVLHQFGLLYRDKSPDKISLVQSAAFFNAAIVRQPSNHQFICDLKDLCFHVLQCANAEKTETDLPQISDEVFEKVSEMRYHANGIEILKNIPIGLCADERRLAEKQQIDFVRNMQDDISKNYVEIMEYISTKCVEIMGKPPCEYSVAGMGSLARKEITPYSDFEHIILLEEGIQHESDYENILEYFRWFTVIFQIIIINLKETVLPSVAVTWLNDDCIPGGYWFYDNFTTCGIKFDGMQLHACKIPLGNERYSGNKSSTVELIKPVSEMIHYLHFDEDIKNGFHLADILTKTCFVAGCKSVHQQFQRGVSEILLDQKWYSNQCLIEQIKFDLIDFGLQTLSPFLLFSPKCNIKRDIYRAITLFVSTLGRLHSIDKCSCLEIVDNLQHGGQISDEKAHMLHSAISVACVIRLKVYISKGGQEDSIGRRNFFHSFSQTLKTLIIFVGEQSLGDYLTTTYSLQKSMKNSETSKLNFQCKLCERFRILELWDLRNLILSDWKGLLKAASDGFCLSIPKTVITIHCRNGNSDEALKLCNFVLEKPKLHAEVKSTALMVKAVCLLRTKRFTEFEEHIGKAKQTIENENTIDRFAYLSILITFEAHFKFEAEFFDEALILYMKAYKYARQANFDPGWNNHIAWLHLVIGMCLTSLGRVDKTIKWLAPAIKMFHIPSVAQHILYEYYYIMGYCNFRLGRLNTALLYYQCAGGVLVNNRCFLSMEKKFEDKMQDCNLCIAEIMKLKK